MDCGEARRRLWPADILRVSDADVEAALEHAERCPACQAFLEEDRRLAQAIREAVPRVRAPRELRERLYTALARERAGVAPKRSAGAGKRRQWVALTMLVLVGLIVGTVGRHLTGRTSNAAAATAFAEDYLRRVVEQDELETTDRREIASFFARELGVAMPAPEVPDFQVQRVTICLMNGRRGGVVEYRGRGHQLTYYLIPREAGAAEASALVDRRGNDSPTVSAPAVSDERGLGVATWWDDDHQHALVSDLTSRELRRLTPLFASSSLRP